VRQHRGPALRDPGPRARRGGAGQEGAQRRAWGCVEGRGGGTWRRGCILVATPTYLPTPALHPPGPPHARAPALELPTGAWGHRPARPQQQQQQQWPPPLPCQQRLRMRPPSPPRPPPLPPSRCASWAARATSGWRPPGRAWRASARGTATPGGVRGAPGGCGWPPLAARRLPARLPRPLPQPTQRRHHCRSHSHSHLALPTRGRARAVHTMPPPLRQQAASRLPTLQVLPRLLRLARRWRRQHPGAAGEPGAAAAGAAALAGRVRTGRGACAGAGGAVPGGAGARHGVLPGPCCGWVGGARAAGARGLEAGGGGGCCCCRAFIQNRWRVAWRGAAGMPPGTQPGPPPPGPPPEAGLRTGGGRVVTRQQQLSRQAPAARVPRRWRRPGGGRRGAPRATAVQVPAPAPPGRRAAAPAAGLAGGARAGRRLAGSAAAGLPAVCQVGAPRRAAPHSRRLLRRVCHAALWCQRRAVCTQLAPAAVLPCYGG
jgi:hypothetical protein